MRACLLLLLCCCTSLWAGELSGDSYVGARFGAIRIIAPASQWLMLDREYSGDNEFGGPVVDLKGLQPLTTGTFPSLHLTAFKRVGPEVNAAFVLENSQNAVRQRGGQVSPVASRALNGKTIWFFDALVSQNDKPARLYYVLLESSQAFFALQTAVPVSAFDETRQRVDELLLKVSYQ